MTWTSKIRFRSAPGIGESNGEISLSEGAQKKDVLQSGRSWSAGMGQTRSRAGTLAAPGSTRPKRYFITLECTREAAVSGEQ
jgi:hypothetical protein